MMNFAADCGVRAVHSAAAWPALPCSRLAITVSCWCGRNTGKMMRWLHCSRNAGAAVYDGGVVLMIGGRDNIVVDVNDPVVVVWTKFCFGKCATNAIGCCCGRCYCTAVVSGLLVLCEKVG